MTDEVERAMDIGRENQEFIELGKAWCTHIRTDRSGFGVGMLEEMTGLPITGGRFACDFARKPGGIAGMRLAVSALDFYDKNCRDCPDRLPGGRIPNLGTWAEQLLAKHAEADEARKAAEEEAAAECRRRADLRTMVSASLDAASQEVVALINRLDADATDADAEESLRAAAKLAPDAFSNPVKEMLRTDARLLKLAVLLEVLVALDPEEDPDLHSLCASAVREGWGRAVGCRYLSQHGTTGDLTDDFLEAVIFHAAPGGLSVFRTRGEPAALLHFHSIAAEAVESTIAAMLRHGESWRRAAAAKAAEEILAADAEAGIRLLGALLDALRYEEDWDDHDDTSAEIGGVVGAVLVSEPSAVNAAIEARWQHASSGYRTRLIGCYDAAARRTPELLPAAVAGVIVARAISTLSELASSDHDLEKDYQGRASDLISITVPVAPTTVLSPDAFLGLLLEWLERDRAHDASEPHTPLAMLEKMAKHAWVGGIVRDISDAVVAVGNRNPGPFLSTCIELYGGTESTPFVRAELVRLMARVASRSLDHVSDALPVIYTSMLGDEQVVRAAGLTAAETVMAVIPSESIPPLLGQAVTAGLGDQFLVVVVAAVQAARRLPTDLEDSLLVGSQLLLIAKAYASDRLQDRLVRDAVAGALRLARGDEALTRAFRSAALRIVALMPPYNARDMLRWNRSLEEDAAWVDVAIAALRMDDDPQYEHLGSDDKEALLAHLGRRRLTDTQIASLASTETDASRASRKRALQAADLFAEQGRPDLSSTMIRAHLDQFPDTIERRGQRRALEATMLQFELETAIAQGDQARRTDFVATAETLSTADDE